MAEIKGISSSRRKGIARLFPSVAEAAANALGASRAETLEILMDVEQVCDLFASLEDRRLGRIVNMSDAFGDL